MDPLLYLVLFFSAFAAATIVPMQSEAVVVGTIASGYSPVTVVVVATIGNVLGSVINWLLGRWIERFRDRKWFPVNAQQLERAEGWYHRYGKWSLLLSWAPIIGDPLTLIAGVLREPLRVFLPLVTIAKMGRYIVLAVMTMEFLGL